ncbi:NAD(P)H-binding protein [Novosphingobium profundi]|uniref:NmrA family NAD(P)-binding protein n=1 Tax=Novosphingobium profundi TaxID=1774954 RepID=UPI001BDB505E|nr:NAD(P)H-binding protein [Novosphingobium profundi]MBT0668110.1 NAD(P)H-binding protein [Novosphingobium profundi]
MIVVTTPAGQIGSKVVSELLAADVAFKVIARDGDKLPEQVRDAADVVSGSHGDPAVLAQALDGADALFWVAPPDTSKTLEATYLDFTRPAVDAIRQHGVRRVVTITALGRGTEWQHKAGLVSASMGMVDLLMSSGAALRGLAMPSFMENTARQVGAMKDKGLFFGPIDPDRKLPFTATRDMGATAARVLLDDSWTGQNELPILGPEDLSFKDQAAIISEVTGREIRYQQVGWDQFKQQFLDRGATESFAQGYVDMYRAKDEGIDNVAERQADLKAPTSFRQFAEEQIKPALAG